MNKPIINGEAKAFLVVFANGRVGGWWLLASALTAVAWFAAGHLVIE